MKKLQKKILVILLALLVVALVVIIAVILNEKPAASSAGATPSAVTPSATATPPASPSPPENSGAEATDNPGEPMELTRLEATLSEQGGPDFSISIDENNYRLTETDSGWRITPVTGGEDMEFLDIAYFDDKYPDDIAPGLLDSYEYVKSLTDEGDVRLSDAVSARYVHGESEDAFWYGYIVEYGAGSVVMVIRTPETGGGYTDLLSFAETIELYD